MEEEDEVPYIENEVSENEILTKRCSKCGEEKDIALFYIRKETGKRRSDCSACVSTRARTWELSNSEEAKKRKKKWFVENRADQLQAMAEYRKIHSEDIKIYQKKYFEQNREKIRDVRRKYEAKRKQTDPVFKLTCNLRHRVYFALKRAGNQKKDSTIELTGCTMQQLKTFLEAEFEPGMSWDNYGKWHVDHIRPCSSFNLEDPEEQKKCFHWTNLQPLWALDNILKRDKWEGT